MNTLRSNRHITIIAVLMLFIALTIVGVTLAQQAAPPTEPDAIRAPALNNIAPTYDSATSTGLAPDENPPDGVRAPNAPSQTFHYYTVSGATMRGRSSNINYTYDSSGCIHLTSGSGLNLIVNTELQLPDNAEIKYLRVIYQDTSGSGSVAGYITRYGPGLDANDLVTAASTSGFAGGYGFVVSQEITETVNNASYAYTLIGFPSSASGNLRICGLRVAYYLSTSSTFVPTVLKEP